MRRSELLGLKWADLDWRQGTVSIQRGLVARAGLPPSRLHDLRHTHATLLIKHNIPVKVVSERLGHAKTCFTIDTYQAVQPWHASRRRPHHRTTRNIDGATDSGATLATKHRRPPSTAKTRLAGR
jgi:integrase